jgi:hypothetical protein
MMNKFDDNANGLKERIETPPGHLSEGDVSELELEQALKDFKSSVHEWSDAAYSRPRVATGEAQHRSWRLALGWAMGCLLVAGSVSGGLFERQHRLEQARITAQQQAAEQQRELRAQQPAGETDEALLVDVDSDVSQQVPSAMEPLAQMMGDDGTK